jgi:hypothetical protein
VAVTFIFPAAALRARFVALAVLWEAAALAACLLHTVYTVDILMTVIAQRRAPAVVVDIPIL